VPDAVEQSYCCQYDHRPVRLSYQPPASNTFLSEQTSHQQPASSTLLSEPCSLGLSATSQQYFSLTTNQPPATSQQYSSLRTNQHQPSATSQPNMLQTSTSYQPPAKRTVRVLFYTLPSTKKIGPRVRNFAVNRSVTAVTDLTAAAR
jgi:hypothetical protein